MGPDVRVLPMATIEFERPDMLRATLVSGDKVLLRPTEEADAVASTEFSTSFPCRSK